MEMPQGKGPVMTEAMPGKGPTVEAMPGKGPMTPPMVVKGSGVKGKGPPPPEGPPKLLVKAIPNKPEEKVIQPKERPTKGAEPKGSVGTELRKL